jgi:periplasmic divalent cation tolerance protein
LVLVTCGSAGEAKAIARRLVEDRLAAGVQMVAIDSIYRWEGEVVDDHEWLMIAKIRRDLFDSVRSTVIDIHSYDVPPILMIDIAAASHPYLDWIDSSVG